jgi:hypothetical protein
MPALATLLAASLVGGCGTTQPPPLSARSLEEAQTFPYYRTYWVGHSFAGTPLAAADGTTGYSSQIGDSVYYGDCVSEHSIVGGTCRLPLQVTTVIYQLESNEALGPQTDTVIRSVPAAIFEGGRSIELYTGRVAIVLYSDSLAHALRAARLLRPLNTTGSAGQALPLPVYCPGMVGPRSPRLIRLMRNLPGRICQQAEAQIALRERQTGKKTKAVP